MIYKCDNCDKEHKGEYGKTLKHKPKDGNYNRFCSRKCSKGFSTKEKRKEINKKISKKLTKDKKLYSKKCLYCFSLFNTYKLKHVFCCQSCSTKYKWQQPIYRKKIMKHLRKNGGYRKGSGRGKSGYYDNIYFDSTWELTFYLYNKYKKYKINRCKDNFVYYFLGEKHKYFPDFIIDNIIYEIKGYHTEVDSLKIDAVKKTGKQIKVLYKKDILPMIDLVTKIYNVKEINELYENYKPEINKCKFCGKEFKFYKSKKSKGIFCSRICGGKGRHLK